MRHALLKVPDHRSLGYAQKNTLQPHRRQIKQRNRFPARRKRQRSRQYPEEAITSCAHCCTNSACLSSAGTFSITPVRWATCRNCHCASTALRFQLVMNIVFAWSRFLYSAISAGFVTAASTPYFLTAASRFSGFSSQRNDSSVAATKFFARVSSSSTQLL